MRGPSRKTLAAIVVAAIAARLLLLAIPFTFTPDTYYYDTQAVQAVISGHDPYGHHYVVPPSLQTSGAENSFAYLPGVVLLLLPFGAAGDVRLGLVACDIIVAYALYSLGGKWSTASSGAYLLVPFTILFSTWYPNNTLVGMAFLGVAVAAWARGKPLLSACFVGLSLASSQLAWLFYPFILFNNLKARRFKETALGLVVASAVAAPFLAWNPGAFIHDTVQFEFGRPVQQLLTPEPFGFNVNPTLSGLSASIFGITIPVALKAVLILVLLAFLIRRSSSLPRVLLTGSYFLLASVFALPNDFSWWYLELPFQLLLAWLVVSQPEKSQKAANP